MRLWMCRVRWGVLGVLGVLLLGEGGTMVVDEEREGVSLELGNSANGSFSPVRTYEHLEEARWWYLSAAVVATILCIAMVRSFALADKRQRLPPANLLRNRTLSDIGNSLAYIIPAIAGVEHSDTACEIQALLIQFFSTASLVWWVSFSLELLWNVRNPFTDHKSHLRIYHLAVWVVSLVSAIALRIYGDIGLTDLDFCWVNAEAPLGLSLVIFYIPVVVCYAFSLCILVWVSLTQRVAIPASHQIRKVAISQNKWYIILIGIFWTFSGVVWFAGHGNADSRTMVILWAVTIALRGLVAEIIWLKTASLALQGYSQNFIDEKVINSVGDGAVSARVSMKELHPTGNDMESAFLRTSHVTATSDHSRVSLPNIRECRESVPLKWALRRDVMLACQQGISAMAEAAQESINSLTDNYQLHQGDFEASVVRQIERWDQDNVSFTFEDVAPLCFYMIRQSTGMTTDVYRSIFNYENVDDVMMEKFSDGGSSGSFFYFTAGREFIVKTITAAETALLKELLPSYYQHLMTNKHSLIVRFYGLHTVKMHLGAAVLNVVVMENVFLTRRPIDEVYDVKGSWIDRGPVAPSSHTAQRSPSRVSTTYSGSDNNDTDSESSAPESPGSGSPVRGRTAALFVKMNLKALKGGKKAKSKAQKHVLKDMDLAGVKQVVVPEETRVKLLDQAKKDCEWFKQHNIMDYSLLLGVHRGGYDELRVPRADLAVDLSAPPDSMQSPLHRRVSRFPYQPPNGGVGRASLQDGGGGGVGAAAAAAAHVIPIYRRDEGGLHNACESEEAHVGDNMYFMGVIDILQQWTLQKKMERFLKVLFLRKDPRGLSAVEPSWYGDRFLERFDETITSPDRMVFERRTNAPSPPPPMSPAGGKGSEQQTFHHALESSVPNFSAFGVGVSYGEASAASRGTPIGTPLTPPRKKKPFDIISAGGFPESAESELRCVPEDTDPLA